MVLLIIAQATILITVLGDLPVFQVARVLRLRPDSLCESSDANC